jgi:hypothetical protein
LVVLLGSSAPGQWAWSEEVKLTASAPYDDDGFAYASDFDGSTLVAGVWGDDHINGFVRNEGSVYVYVRSGTSWVEQAVLIASAPALGDFFGISVALSGDTILVGAHGRDHSGLLNAGAVFVFVRSGTTWSQQAMLVASEAKEGDLFGLSVALEGDTALAGAFTEDPAGVVDAGAAYVFVRSGTTWSQQARLTAGDAAAGDRFGDGVALSGDTALIGAFLDDHSGLADAGAAYVCVRNGSSWTEQAKLVASDPKAMDWFAYSVSLDGDTAAIGAELDDVPGVSSNQGSAYVFARTGSEWGEQAKLVASDGESNDLFGNSITNYEDTVLVGSVSDDPTPGGTTNRSGSVYVWQRDGAVWTEQARLVANDAASGDEFGVSVALSASGDTALIGAGRDDNLGGFNAGAAYVFELGPGAPVTYCTAGSSASGCSAAISASGTASATAASGFGLSAAAVEGGKDGLFFFGTNGRQANPWGGGSSYRCVVPPVKRGALLGGAGTPGLCDGSFAADLNALWCPTCPKPLHNPGAGAVVQAQLWYRDPGNTSNQTTSLSDAIEFGVGP